jgi:hypothetical protein
MLEELRLDFASTPVWVQLESPLHVGISPERMLRNIQRTWMVLFEWDRGLSFIRSRPGMMRAHASLGLGTIEQWWTHKVCQTYERAEPKVSGNVGFDDLRFTGHPDCCSE